MSKKILVLDIPGNERDQLAQALHPLVGKEINVVFIGPNSRSYGDWLLLPGTGGYNCTGQGFIPHFALPPLEVPGQNQWMEHFLSYQLDYYKNKHIPICGFGTSAAAVWDIVLRTKEHNNKLTVNDEGLIVPVRDDEVAKFDVNGNFYGEGGVGFPTMPIKDAVKLFLKLLTEGTLRTQPPLPDEGDLEYSTVPTIPPILPGHEDFEVEA